MSGKPTFLIAFPFTDLRSKTVRRNLSDGDMPFQRCVTPMPIKISPAPDRVTSPALPSRQPRRRSRSAFGVLPDSKTERPGGNGHGIAMSVIGVAAALAFGISPPTADLVGTGKDGAGMVSTCIDTQRAR